MFFSSVTLRVDVTAIAANYRLLHGLGGNACSVACPVIKADAYGHGLERTALALHEQGAGIMAVGNVEEAVRLRATPGLPESVRIIVLLGPQDVDEVQAVWRHKFLPFVYRFDQLRMLQDSAAPGATKPLPIACKFDTGMARLGFVESELDALFDVLAKTPALRPEFVVSHLAAADEPQNREFTLEQGRRFEGVVQRFRRGFPEAKACLANSAGLMAYPELRWDMQRPGLALYGANPFAGTEWEDKGHGLTPAMQAWAPIVQVHELRRGTPISYGATYTADEDKTVAIVAAGYSDFYSRHLSSRDGRGAAMLIHGRRAPVLGRVCMQLTAVDVTRIPEARAGDEAWLLGGGGAEAIRPEELARWQGSIPYDVFTSLGRNTRVYS